MAQNAVPQVKDMKPTDFGKALSVGEIALGTALLAPVVPSALAGAALTGFGGALIRMYLTTPGMTEEGSVRPSQQGTPIAKDIWLVGAGLSLLIGGLTPKRKRK
jgi:hypothetical protein